MAYNLIQFQQGMSLPEFLLSFSTESACCEAVLRARWPAGFVCPRCGSSAHCILFSLGRPLFQCHACHRQTSLTAGTLFGSTKLPLTTWFLAIYFISQAKTGLSALELKRHIGVSYPTAWLMHHKIMTAMAAREAQHRLSGAVQVDDAYLGGERAGGKPGRGSENKVPFVAAVSLNEAGNPRFAKLTPVPGFTSEAISAWSQANLTAGASVLSDGLACFAAVTDAGCTHTVEVVGQRKPRELPQFKWVNTILANAKTMISGAYKAFGYAKYADHYLGAFCYRFNRRFDLTDLVVRLVVDVCRCAATPQRVIRQA
jgi:transposase-like protein